MKRRRRRTRNGRRRDRRDRYRGSVALRRESKRPWRRGVDWQGLPDELAARALFEEAYPLAEVERDGPRVDGEDRP